MSGKRSPLIVLLVIITLLFPLSELLSQLDSIHYIPPLHSRQNSQIEDHYVYLSTPETNPFPVTVTDGSGAQIPGSPFVLSNANPVVISIGNGQSPATNLMIPLSQLNQVLTDKGLILSGPEDFFVNARYRSTAQAEALTSKGRSAAGTEFRVGLMPVPSEQSFRNFVIGIMATQNNTVVDISEYDPGVIFNGPIPVTADALTLYLDQGECYVLSGYTDNPANLDGMVGALIESNNAIVVNSGNMCGTIGPATGGQDMALDQIVPTNKMGNHYVVVEGQGNSFQERPMVLAHYDDTQVFINGAATPVTTLSAGQYYIVNNTYYSGASHRNMYINTSEPAYLIQFLAGSSSDVTPGMNILPAVDCSLPTEVDLIPFIDKIGDVTYSGGLFIITETGSTLTLNGAVQSGAEAVTGYPAWESYKLLGLTGNAAISSTGGLAVGIYGYSGAAGFAGYYAGFSSILDVVADGDTLFCEYNIGPVNITAETEGGMPPYSYQWDQGLGGGPDHTVFPQTTTEYIVTVTDQGTCTSTDKVVVEIIEPPQLDITPDPSICFGSSATINVSITNEDGVYEYIWDNGLPNASSHTVSPTSNTLYSVTVVDENGCENSTQTLVSVDALPQTEITGTGVICEGESSVLDAGQGFTQYSWNTGDNAQAIVANLPGIYNVTVTDENGCTNTDDFELIVSQNPVVLAGEDMNICLGSNGLLIGQAFGGTEPFLFVWDQGLGEGAVQLITPEEDISYTLTVIDALGCSGTDNINITVSPAPELSITGDNELCEGFNTVLQGTEGFEVYSWNTGEESSSITVDSTGFYILSILDENNCEAVDTFEVSVADSIQPTISGELSICDGISATLDPGPNYSSYQWSTGDTSQFISVDTAGIYSVSVTNNAGCSGSAFVETNVFEAPQIAEISDIQLCQGDSISFSIEVSGGEGPYIYTWSDSTLTADSIMLFADSSAFYILTVTDINNCNDEDSIQFIVNSIPMAEAGSDTTLCYGESISLQGEGLGGEAPYTYSWDSGIGPGAYHNIVPDSSMLISLEIFDANGCFAKDSIMVEVNQEIIAEIQGVTDFCIGLTSQLSVIQGNYSILWSTGESDDIIDISSGGNYYVTLTDASGCYAIDSVAVTVLDSLQPQISGEMSICAGDTSILLLESSYDHYIWNTGDTVSSIQVLEEGMYHISVFNNDGCSGSAEVFIQENPLPQIQTSGDLDVCQGDSVEIWASGQGGAGPFDYSWNNNLGSGPSHSFVALNSSAYSVTISDQNGCQDFASLNLNVKPVPQAIISAIDDFCQSENINCSYFGNIDPDQEYFWFFDDANVQSGNNEGPYVLNYNSPGDKLISLVVTLNGCSDTSEQFFSVFPISESNITEQACENYNWNGTEYTVSGYYQFDTVNMYGCDSIVYLDLNIYPQYDTLFEYIVCDADQTGMEVSELQSTFGCDSTVTEIYLLGESLEISLGNDLILDFGEMANINLQLTGNPDNIFSIQWQGIPDLDCPDCFEQHFIPEASGVVTVIIEDINGCIYTASLVISVLHSNEIYAPNIFSPDNDGINDFFFIQGSPFSIKKINQISIFDRWGNLLYARENASINDPAEGWDGTVRGKSINPGVYVWFAEIEFNDGSTQNYSGDITLIH